jgi:hypothetical protein
MRTDETLRVLKLVNFDAMYEYSRHHAPSEPIILNHFDYTDPDYMTKLSELVFSDGTGADFVAKCHCGELSGNQIAGQICRICGSEVSRNNLLDSDNLICRNWVTAPKELVHGWLTPKIYLNLANWLAYDKGRKSYINDILDVDADLPYDIRDFLESIDHSDRSGKGRGFTFLYNHFDRIMNYFIYDHPTISKKSITPSIKFCMELYRDIIFCRYVPILNSAINPIVTQEGGGPNRRKYSDVTADHILKAMISLSRLEFSPKKRHQLLHAERTAYKAYRNIIDYIEEATKKYIATKKAIPRTSIFGSRFHFSFRGVIVPIVGPHLYYELHIPWKMAVNTLRVHIKGILCREYDMGIHEVEIRVRRALNKFDPLIKEIMDRMIEESPFPGLPCLWDRPPSIRDGSVMLKYWTKIKTDLEDSAIGMSSLDVALQNA